METNKSAIIMLAGIGILAASAVVEKAVKLKHDAEQAELDRQAELEKARIVLSYPAEYWQAQTAEAEAKAEVEKAKIESDERLTIDARERQTATYIRQEEFEKNAPAEYWQAKRAAEEEQTKREAEKLRHEAELAKARAAERTVKSAVNSWAWRR
jgi:hypothetical protein